MPLLIVPDPTLLDGCGGLMDDDCGDLDGFDCVVDAALFATTSAKEYRLRLSPADHDAFVGRALSQSARSH